MIGYVILTGFALFIASLFAHLAWTGKIKFGTKTLLDRRMDRPGFWIVWTIFAGVTIYFYVEFVIKAASLPGGPLAQ